MKYSPYSRERKQARLKNLAGAYGALKTRDPDAEKIVSVAIRRDGRLHSGFKSHYELRQSIYKFLDPETRDPQPDFSRPMPGDENGFYTSKERFVTREEAKSIGVASGQLAEFWLTTRRELLSSDIW